MPEFPGVALKPSGGHTLADGVAVNGDVPRRWLVVTQRGTKTANHEKK
ncbi:MAG: hypothetical protein IPO80_12865 [Propionibacteriaceae bacterium]|nr:hypothetical protein [Propionibacteriaceae bacterium]